MHMMQNQKWMDSDHIDLILEADKKKWCAGVMKIYTRF